MNFMSLPPEVRAIIYDLCFPPTHSQVQLVPYRASLPVSHLNIPLSLYRVCKLIYAELPPLATKLRALDLVYILRGPFIIHYSNLVDDFRLNKYPDLAHFRAWLRFAERLRFGGPEATITDLGKSSGSSSSNPRKLCPRCTSSGRLRPGPGCAASFLEVQPGLEGLRFLTRPALSCFEPLTVHPDVARRLQVRLIRERGASEVEEEKGMKIEADLNRYLDSGSGNNREWRFTGQVLQCLFTED